MSAGATGCTVGNRDPMVDRDADRPCPTSGEQALAPGTHPQRGSLCPAGGGRRPGRSWCPGGAFRQRYRASSAPLSSGSGDECSRGRCLRPRPLQLLGYADSKFHKDDHWARRPCMNLMLQRQLEDAAWDGDANLVAHLIKHPGVNPAAHHSTALLHAAHRGHWRIVEMLIPLSNPRARRSEALYRAAKGRHQRHGRCVVLLAPLSDTRGWQDWEWAELPPWSIATLQAAPAVSM